MQALNITELLSGKAMGRASNNASTALEKMGRSPETSVQRVLLQGQLALFRDAQGLLPDKIHTLAHSARKSLIERLQAGSITIPPFCRGSLLAVSLKEHALVDRIQYLMPLLPGEAAPPFDPSQPSLKTTGQADADTGRLVHRCIISEAILPCICNGEKQSAELLDFVTVLLREWCEFMEDDADYEKFSPFLRFALEEVVVIAKCLLAIVSEELNEKATAKHVHEVMDAKQGVKMIVKQACFFEVVRCELESVAVPVLC